MKQLCIKPISQPAKMSSYWKKEWMVMLAVLITGTLFNVCMSAGPILQGVLLDTLLQGAPLSRLFLAAASFVGVILLIQLVRILKRYYVRIFANRTCASMRRILYHNIMGRDVRKLRQESTGDLMNKAVTDVDICVEGMRKVTTEVFDTGVLMVSYFIAMLLYDVKITVIACLFIPISMCLAQFLKKIIVKFTLEARRQSSRIAEMTYDHLSHAMLFRINGIEELNHGKYEQELALLSQKSIRSGILENSMQPIYQAISLLGIAYIFYRGGSNVVTGLWSVGMFSAYLVIFTSLAAKSSKAAKLFNSFQKASVSWKRIKPYLAETPSVEHNHEIPDSSFCMLTVKKLSFTYPGNDIPILHDISFSAQQGSLVAVTGPVACGKTTLGMVLAGLYDYEGVILFNASPLSSYTQAQRSRLIAYMGHAPSLLSDTIYENITLGEEGDVAQVLRDVCFDTDLRSMPEGILTKVGNSGIRLSGGQQARIALARALYSKSKLLILDDPFSAVDQKTERMIIRNLKEFYRDRIILLISHRLTIFPESDAVLFLAEKEMPVFGTHDDLLHKCDLYRTIYRLQAGKEAAT